jgi:gluconate 2-dehydrogenase gamma chain
VSGPSRRDLLGTSAALLGAPSLASAAVVKDALPWAPGHADPPPAVEPGPWQFFNQAEADAIEAMVDRLIPPDPETPGGKDAGCAVFIDRQLAGPFGRNEDHYNKGPFHQGTKEQGDQSPLTPAQYYRSALAAVDAHCKAKFGGSTFARLPDERKDEVLKGLESGGIKLEGVESAVFFKLLLTDTQHGFFADPVYGGNRDMVAWKMIGFPGARYDYRDWVHRHNERYPHPPISIRQHPNWKPE